MRQHGNSSGGAKHIAAAMSGFRNQDRYTERLKIGDHPEFVKAI
jgi:hypothetical protein